MTHTHTIHLARPVVRHFEEDPHWVGQFDLYGMHLAVTASVEKDQSAATVVFTPNYKARNWDTYTDGTCELELSKEHGAFVGKWRCTGSEAFDIRLTPRRVKRLPDSDSPLGFWGLFELTLSSTTA